MVFATSRSVLLLVCTSVFLRSIQIVHGRGGGLGGTTDSDDLTAQCDTSGSSADYTEELSGTGTTMERNAASATGCPNHVNWPLNPNSARQISSDETIPAYPMLIASEGTTDLSSAVGGVGIMFNGVSVFSSWARDAATSYETAAFYLEGDTFDLCGGHSTSEGWYHYHNTAGCLQEQAMVAADTTSNDHSPQLGWSYDGFPIYGQLGPDGVEMLLCGQQGANETHCLDLCSGHEGELSEVDDYTYRYYSSCGFDEAFFPFTTNCYRGCCPTGMTCAGYVDECGTSATEGYTENYVPAAGTSLAVSYETDLIDGDDSDQIGSDNSLDCSLYQGSATSNVGSSGAWSFRTTMSSTGSISLATSVATTAAAAVVVCMLAV